MNIKEIAPKLTQKLSIAINDDEAVEFAEALIESHKAELLKEVGEPVGYMTTDEEGSASMLFFDRSEALKYSGDDDPVNLFTSDQLTAAIAKSEQRIAELEAETERLRDAVRQQESQVLREQATSLDIYQQLKAAQEDITEMRADHLMLAEENHALREQLATAEQRVAEACYRALDEAYGNEYQLKAIGEYRKYMKGE